MTSRQIKKAPKGSGDAAYSFYKLGLDIKKLKAMNAEKQFRTIGDALLKVGNETERAAYAQALFGRAGQDVLAFLSDYPKLAKEAQDAGLIFSAKDIEAAEKIEDTWERLKALGKKGVLAGGLLQDMGKFVSFAGEAAQIFGKLQESLSGKSGKPWKESPSFDIGGKKIEVPSGFKGTDLIPLGPQIKMAEFSADVWTAILQVLKDRLPGGTNQEELAK